jgi:hypothetical protein
MNEVRIGNPILVISHASPDRSMSREGRVVSLEDRLPRKAVGMPDGFFCGFPVHFRLTRRRDMRRGQGRGRSETSGAPSGRPASWTEPSPSSLDGLGSQSDFGRAGWTLIDNGGCRSRSWSALPVRHGQNKFRAPATRAVCKFGAGPSNDLSGWSKTSRRAEAASASRSGHGPGGIDEAWRGLCLGVD